MDLPPPPPPPSVPPGAFEPPDGPGQPVQGDKMWYAQNHILAGVAIVMWMLSSYRATQYFEMSTAGPMLVGIPTTLALLLIYLPAKRGPVTPGTTIRAITLVILLGIILLPEGIICWIMVLPIVLLVALIALSASGNRNTRRAILFLPLIVFSFEGAVIGDLVSTQGRVTAVETYDLSSNEVVEQLGVSPEYPDPDGFLSIGFPTPVDAYGSGLEVGDIRVVEFTGGSDEAPSELRMEITHSSPGRVVFAIVSDTTPLANWMDIQESEVLWTEGSNGTEVSWTMRWERKVHPGVYFGPAQQFGMNQAAEYLLETVVG